MPARRPASQVERARSFGAHVRALRRERKMTQRDVAKQIPMSAGHLSRIETGDYGPPSDETIERIAVALEADPFDLLRAAGRYLGRHTFEAKVLSELQAIRTDLHELLRRARADRA